MFLPSSVRIAIYISLCSFPISDGWQRKKPLHPPKTHSFRLGVYFPFPMLWSASSAAGFLRRYSEILPGCVLRSQYQGFRFLLFWSSRTACLKFIRCIYRPYFFASFTACTLYSFSYCLFSDIPFSSISSFSYFIPLRLGCQVLLYYITIFLIFVFSLCINYKDLWKTW